MALIVLAVILTVLVVFFFLVTKEINQASVVEVMISTSWSKSFAAQNLEDKKCEYLLKNSKFHMDSEKKIKKKSAEWDKQIASFKETANKYMSGKTFSILDAISVFGYNLLVKFKLDANSEMIRNITRKCESSGYMQLERGQETNGKRNSALYAYFLLASFVGYLYVGIVLAVFLALLMFGMGREMANVLMFVIVGVALPTLIGYLPMEELRTRAEKRQEKIDRDFPDILSKTALLVTAGMNIVKALGEAAASGDSIIYMEMQRVMKEINQSSSVTAAFSSLQSRCNNRYLDRMVSLITKSYDSGNVNLPEDLREINRECWLEKKHQSRRMGEMVQNKLFIPTMLMFVGILVVIIIPAMSGFSF